MSKKIGIIAEDLSDIEVINEILEKYIDHSAFSIKKFVGNGCGKLRNKCDVWAKLLTNMGCDHILIFHDLDRNKESEIRIFLSKKVCKEEFPNSFIVIPIEELEAWLLSDSIALKKTFNLKKAPKKISNCESIQSPKEHLRDIIWSIGKKRYLNTSHNKKIARNISLPSLRRCRSYRPLDKYIIEEIFA